MLMEEGFFAENREEPLSRITKEEMPGRKICSLRKYSNRKADELGSFCWMKKEEAFVARITEDGICREIPSDEKGLPQLLRQWALTG